MNSSTNNKLLLLGMKNAVEIKGVVCARTFQMKFLNRSASLFPTQGCIIPTGQKHSVKLDVAFPVELSGMAIIKLMTLTISSHTEGSDNTQSSSVGT